MKKKNRQDAFDAGRLSGLCFFLVSMVSDQSGGEIE
jgi:hypothetical protein